MRGQVNGFNDIFTIIANERKVGGAIEAEKIRLRSGEEFQSPVITNIDYSGSIFYSISFVSDDGSRMIINVNDISMIAEPVHKKLHEINNRIYREHKTEEKIRYLGRLCEVNEGSCTPIFLEEAKEIVEDIGYDAASEQIDLSLLNDKKRMVKIA
jgi:hypothetical protein